MPWGASRKSVSHSDSLRPQSSNASASSHLHMHPSTAMVSTLTNGCRTPRASRGSSTTDSDRTKAPRNASDEGMPASMELCLDMIHLLSKRRPPTVSKDHVRLDRSTAAVRDLAIALPISYGCLTYPFERTLHTTPALCPRCGLLSRVSLDQVPSLHRLRGRRALRSTCRRRPLGCVRRFRLRARVGIPVARRLRLVAVVRRLRWSLCGKRTYARRCSSAAGA